MALQLTYTDSFGQVWTNAYWSITQILYLPLKNRGQITITSYAAAAQKGNRALDNREVFLTAAQLNTYFGSNQNILTTAYIAVQTIDPFFASATVVA